MYEIVVMGGEERASNVADSEPLALLLISKWQGRNKKAYHDLQLFIGRHSEACVGVFVNRKHNFRFRRIGPSVVVQPEIDWWKNESSVLFLFFLWQ